MTLSFEMNINLGKKGISGLILTALLFYTLFSLVNSDYASNARAQTEPVLEDVLFDSNNGGFNQKSREILDENVEILKNNSAYLIKLEGYSDRRGDNDYNLVISLKRAQQVGEYLVNSGIEADRIEAVGKGETDKYDKGESDAELGENRRVVFVLEFDESRVLPVIEEDDTDSDDQDNTADELSELSDSSAGAKRENDPNLLEAELPQLPDDIIEVIGEGIIAMAPGEIIFETPLEMRMGKTYLLQVEVPNSFVDEFMSELKRSSATVRALTVSNDVIIRLTGSGFEFEPVEESPGNGSDITGEDGFIGESVNEYTNWQWLVSPNRSGYQSLVASIIVNIENPKYLDDDVMAETFEKVIYVKPGLIESITNSYLLLTIVIILLVSLILWIVLRFYSSNNKT